MTLCFYNSIFIMTVMIVMKPQRLQNSQSPQVQLSKCSINNRSRNVIGSTCFTKSDLIELIKAYNVCSKKNSSSKSAVYYNQGYSKEKLYSILQEHLSTRNESKWIKLPFVKYMADTNKMTKITHYVFKPVANLKRYAWLSDVEITEYMLQLTKYLNNKGIKFRYMGTVSSDYFSVHPEGIPKIKEFLDKGYSVGLIFNTDPLSKPGKHWVSVFLNGKDVEYFDPVGSKPNQNIQSFLQHFMCTDCKFTRNTKMYQTKNGNCGLFAIDYLHSRSTQNEYINKGDLQTDHLRHELFIAE